MSELQIDNPAQRLLDILEAGKQYPKTDNCRAVWQKIWFCRFNIGKSVTAGLAII